jgi:glycosyltransferase involved in cell wall biosynthesis
MKSFRQVTGARYGAPGELSPHNRRTEVFRRRTECGRPDATSDPPRHAILSESLSAIPRISIVIPSLNQGRFIEETIRSIVDQGWPDLELIIIDGGSTDETLAIIRKYEASIAFWVSEPDGGQADAINKGLRKATGDVVTWFGADDIYAAGIFAAVVEAWRRNPNAIYAAPVANFYSRGREHLIRPYGLVIENVVQYWTRKSLWHDPGLFWPRGVIDAVGDLDTSLRYAFDYDFLVRALQHVPVEYIDHVAAGFRLHRQSKTISQTEQMMAETAAVSRRYWPLIPNLDREGFEQSEYEARLRRAASKLLRLNRDGFPLLRACLRERPIATVLRLVLLIPTVLAERLGRLRPGKHI